MGRFSYKEIDRAEQLEKWVQELTNETNRDLDGAELYNVDLVFRNPFTSGEKKYFNGFVTIHIRFDKNQPKFLTDEDRELWYSKVMEIVGGKFGFSDNLYFTSIPFEEPSEERLYSLTMNKQDVIRKGFSRVKNYANFYISAVKLYENVVKSHKKRMKKHLTKLESIPT